MVDPLVLSGPLHAEIVRHARESLPREAVGLIGGTAAGGAKTVVPLANIAPGNGFFLADPYEQYRAFRRLESQGLVLLAIYHSHPGGCVDPSPLDLRFAERWDCAHLVVAVETSGLPDGTCRAFRRSDLGTWERATVRLDRGATAIPTDRLGSPGTASSAAAGSDPPPSGRRRADSTTA